MLRRPLLAIAPATLFAGAFLSAQSAPSFAEYRAAGPVFSGKPAAPVLKTAYDRSFRTAIRDAAARGPNFAAHYTIAEWGCGGGCVSIVIVDASDGAVYPGPFRNLASEEPRPLEYRLDSRLLIARGCPEEAACASYFWEWTGSEFKLIRKLPPTPPGTFFGQWKIVDAKEAPWAAAKTRKPNIAEAKSYIGKTVAIEAKSIRGPGVLACGNPQYYVKDYPADWLFQGAFGEMHGRDKSIDPLKVAEQAGFRGSSWKTLETGCEGPMDYHFIDSHTAAFGLNNSIYILKKQP